MSSWWPFGKKEAPAMKAASRVQCYDNRDVYFFCLGATASSRRGKRSLRQCWEWSVLQCCHICFASLIGERERAISCICTILTARKSGCRAKWRRLPQVQTLGEEGVATTMHKTHNHAQNSRIAAILHFHTSLIALAHDLIVFQQY
jgi:hypothetical protein